MQKSLLTSDRWKWPNVPKTNVSCHKYYRQQFWLVHISVYGNNKKKVVNASLCAKTVYIFRLCVLFQGFASFQTIHNKDYVLISLHLWFYVPIVVIFFHRVLFVYCRAFHFATKHRRHIRSDCGIFSASICHFWISHTAHTAYSILRW